MLQLEKPERDSRACHQVSFRVDYGVKTTRLGNWRPERLVLSKKIRLNSSLLYFDCTECKKEPNCGTHPLPLVIMDGYGPPPKLPSLLSGRSC